VNAIRNLQRRVFPLLVIGALTACQDTGEQNTQGAVARGRAFAQTNCATCHAIDPTGESPYAPAIPFRELSQNYPVENLAEALAEGIGVGHSGEVQMPEYTLNPEEIDEFLGYLATIQE
jgi:cytochrome c